jgi:hypothetical protein
VLRRLASHHVERRVAQKVLGVPTFLFPRTVNFDAGPVA